MKDAKSTEAEETIPGGMILAGNCHLMETDEGNNVAGHARLFAQIEEKLKTVMDGPVIVLSAAEVANLQALQKKIVAGCLQIDITDEDENEKPSTKVNFFCSVLT